MARPLAPHKHAGELKPGDMIRIADPPSNGRVKSVETLPDSRIERGIEGGDPQPAVLIRFLYMDGPKRGERGEALQHPQDRVRLPS